MSAFVTRVGNFATRNARRGLDYSGKKLPIFKKYALVELVPPTPVEMFKAVGQAGAIVKKGLNGGWKEMTVFQLTLSAVVMIEPPLWFVLGECIGRQGLEGYNIEGTKYNALRLLDFHTSNIGLDCWPLKIEPEEGVAPASSTVNLSTKEYDDIKV